MPHQRFQRFDFPLQCDKNTVIFSHGIIALSCITEYLYYNKENGLSVYYFMSICVSVCVSVRLPIPACASLSVCRVFSIRRLSHICPACLPLFNCFSSFFLSPLPRNPLCVCLSIPLSLSLSLPKARFYDNKTGRNVIDQY